MALQFAGVGMISAGPLLMFGITAEVVGLAWGAGRLYYAHAVWVQQMDMRCVVHCILSRSAACFPCLASGEGTAGDVVRENWAKRREHPHRNGRERERPDFEV